MKELHIEGVAIHDDPESCAGGCEAEREALTGACTGTVLSLTHLIVINGQPTLRPRVYRSQFAGPHRGHKRLFMTTERQLGLCVPRPSGRPTVAILMGRGLGPSCSAFDSPQQPYNTGVSVQSRRATLLRRCGARIESQRVASQPERNAVD